jgi:hypothetical protein
MFVKSFLVFKHDNSKFIANNITTLHEEFIDMPETERLVWFISACEDIDNIRTGNPNNSRETLRDVIISDMEEWYEDQDDDDKYDNNNKDNRTF